MTTALVLAGHGSHISPQTAGLVWAHVDALREMGIADEITAAFWKEMPSFSTVFNTLTSDDITVVPLFTAQGYFTQTVIPAEMRLTSPLTIHDGRTIRYARTLSEHPYLSQVVRQRVEDGLKLFNTPPENVAVAIIGHSTRRNPESRRATEAQAANIRALGIAAQVEAVYLDDTPEIADIYDMTTAPNLIAVPYFLALGSHTTIDVPGELALASGESYGRVNGRTVYYTQPVGTEEALREIILELAHDAGASLYEPSRGDGWRCFPTKGWDVFIDTVETHEVLRFGDLQITPTEIRVWGDDEGLVIINQPSTLRVRVRENPFRSLATSRDLPTGWGVPVSSPQMLCAAVETIYPGAITDWVAHQSGSFQLNSLQKTIERQTGNYRQLESLDDEQQKAIIHKICGQCVRHPTWYHGESPANAIPCHEPCNRWLSAALESIE